METTKIINCFEPLWDVWKHDEILGSGSDSTVYKISKKEFGKKYESALKLVTIPSKKDILEIKGQYADISSKEAIEYVHNLVKTAINEVVLLYEFKGHSNIINYEDHMIKKLSDNEWAIFIKMELAKLLSLYLEENDFTIDKLIKLGIDLCSGLETLHRNNILHRDIRESNIFISNNSSFKLGDLNLTDELSSPAYTKVKVGTFCYIPPEVLIGNGHTKKSDIYSLGVVLYKLLNNGDFLIKDTSVTIRDYYQKLSITQFKPPKNSFKGLSDILSRACSLEPDSRYNTIEEFKYDLLKLNLQFKDNKEFYSKRLEDNIGDTESIVEEEKKVYYYRGVKYVKE